MWTIIDGLDWTYYIPFDTISLQQTINDPAPTLNFDVRDDGSLFSFNINDEVIVWKEDAPSYPSASLRLIPTPPSHNIVQLPEVSGTGTTGAWSSTGALTSIISGFPGLFPVVTFSNTTYTSGNNTAYLTAITPAGYIRANQQYMFSVYATISAPLVNAQAIVMMQFLDGNQSAIGSATSTSFNSTTMNGLQRISISATAPTNAAYIQVWFGGQATTSGSNSGAINYGTPQLEPVWFPLRGVSYPTPDCNYYQGDCALMPDGTTSRAIRYFSGIINDFKVEYIGPNRTWHIQCAGPGNLLENGDINATFTNQYDSTIISSIITSYFSTQIAINQANSALPSPVIQGALISSTVYSGNTLREVLNGLSDSSGYIFFLDNYYRLNYQPQFSSSASFTLSDSPDNITSFPYYDYEYEQDGTQLKRRIKINGGAFSGTKQDLFSGNGSTKQFALTYVPDKITSLVSASVVQRVGVYGRDSFTGSYDVLLNTQSQYILFNAAPPSGTNNILCTYTYKAPITTQTSLQTSNTVAPSYTQPLFDAKVNDTNITDLATATNRGLAEIAKYGNPLEVFTFSSQEYAPAGQAIFFTSTADGVLNQPIIVQQVTGTMIGKSLIWGMTVNEFKYSCGSYQPTLIDQIRNSNKALNRSASVANTFVAQQFDFVAMEIIGYRDSITPTPQSTFAVGIYGNTGSKYGACSYGGSTGLYGSTAHYGMSTIYG